MRDLKKMIVVIKKLVPEDFTHRQDLFHELDKIDNSLNYAPPELVPMWWGEVGQHLNAYVGIGGDPWTEELEAVFTGKKDYEVYL